MNLKDLHTTTSVTWSADAQADTLAINGTPAERVAVDRVHKQLQIIRERFGITMFADVESVNNFPMGTGIASSAASFSALTFAAVSALGETLSERELSTIARCGSGSASRSIPAGFVEWYAGDTHESSYAETFVDADHWDLVDVIAIVSKRHKRTGSSAGHPTAKTSILQAVRVEYADDRLQAVKDAILRRDFERFAHVVEQDSDLMHAVMMTSNPPLFYWEPTSLEIMKTIREERTSNNLQVCYTLDAGPNVHCICAKDDADRVVSLLQGISEDIEIRTSPVGGGAHLVPSLEA
jgi:diphosphomevalonate decarboxylase